MGDGRAGRRTTSLAMSTNAPFSLPAIKWVPPVRPLSAQQQEYETEEQALAAVNDAIPHIAKAAHMVQTVCIHLHACPLAFRCWKGYLYKKSMFGRGRGLDGSMARMFDHLVHLITPSPRKLRDSFESQHDSFLACISACGLSVFLLICSCNHACFELSGLFSVFVFVCIRVRAGAGICAYGSTKN